MILTVMVCFTNKLNKKIIFFLIGSISWKDFYFVVCCKYGYIQEIAEMQWVAMDINHDGQINFSEF